VPDETITSPANPRIKAAAGLRDRRTRERAGLTLVDGARELRRALDAGWPVTEAFVCDPLLAGADARAALAGLVDRRVPTVHVSETAFAKVAFGDRAEGLVGVVRTPTFDLDGLTLHDDPLLVVLEGVEKPGNVGAVMRSADGAGADGLIAASPRTDLANPNVIRASAGTVFAVPMAAGRSEVVRDWLASRGIRMLTAQVGAGRAYTDADLTGPVALVLGAEDDGLTAAWDEPGVEPISLPMRGIADSLNVSATAAILLYEARRQRDARPSAPD
jgi:TrmH family RNA methyltransferase